MTLKPTQQIQQELFLAIKRKLASGDNLAKAVASALHISIDAAYKKIRGERILDLFELQRLFSVYDLPDDVLGLNISQPKVSFTFNSNPFEVSFEQHLLFLIQQCESYLKGNLKAVIYAAREIPLFYFGMFPELLQFKGFMWRQSSMEGNAQISHQFSLVQIDKNLEVLGQELALLFMNMPGIELWSTDTIYNSFKAIQFCKEAGLLESESTYQQLCQSFANLLTHIKQQTLVGKKIERYSQLYRAEFTLFQNELLPGDDSILVQTAHKNMALFATHSGQLFISDDPRVCAPLELAMLNLMRQSICLSKQHERYVTPFFAHKGFSSL